MLLLENRKAKQEYEILEKFQAGVVLSGGEVKSLRNKSGSFVGSYIRIISGKPVLLNAQITPYTFADNRDYDPKRTRQLLLKKSEIAKLQEALEKKGATLVPLAFELVGRHIKLQFGIGRGKKEFERRSYPSLTLKDLTE